jgi:hypothetical protein
VIVMKRRKESKEEVKQLKTIVEDELDNQSVECGAAIVTAS